MKAILKKKVENVNVVQEHRKAYQDVIFFDYSGFSVAQMSALRENLRENSAFLQVFKNNFLKRAFSDVEGLQPFFVKPSAAIFVKDDQSSAVLKKLYAFFATAPQLKRTAKAGLIDNGVVLASDLEMLSKLPSRLEMIQILLGTLQAPLRNFAYALTQISEQKD